MNTQQIRLQDRHDLEKSPVLLTGTQALIRLLIAQKRLDEESGLATAGFVSGYRGSPLGGLDTELWRCGEVLKKNQISFQPGLNEDLAATSCWGTQQIGQFADNKVDGVFAMWYGKGPGVDRSGDPFKHANRQGTSAHGGVLLVFGDDHPGKSSTVSHQSELALAANSIPVLYPASIDEIVSFGLFGWAMSRFSGALVSMKLVNDTVEATSIVDCPWPPATIDRSLRLPELTPVLNTNYKFGPLEDEIRLECHKLPAIKAFAKAHRIDRIEFEAKIKNLGLVTAGKAYLDTKSALRHLGIDEQLAKKLGVSLLKVGMVWPLEPETAQSFGRCFRELLFIEEKQAVVEPQFAELLYNLPANERPIITGKRDMDGQLQLPSAELLDPWIIAILIGKRLDILGLCNTEIKGRLNKIESMLVESDTLLSAGAVRLPDFCSGCPHNTSTLIPEGSIAMSGIGCHTMAVWKDRNTTLPTQMGGEGANWIGIAAYVGTRHVFQNLGDGTYAHSGLLAIRAAQIAGVNITYKILYNDAVAMTGGQPVDGNFSVYDIAHQVRAEGVKSITLVSDDIDKFTPALFPVNTVIRPRNELDAVQRDLREIEGVSLLIYEQTCAAEKRRRRKRGLLETPDRTVFINSRVCEGCGDCSAQSNCVSILPLETEFGRKRQIDQASCNKDFRCTDGFCPSFVSVKGAVTRANRPDQLPKIPWIELPSPPIKQDDDVYNIIITGIGGTGVVTVGAVLAMAARLDHKGASVFDMTGLAQKGGAVLSHLRILDNTGVKLSPKIGVGECNLLLGCDLVVASGKNVLSTINPESTVAVVNSHFVPTAEFQQKPDCDLNPLPLIDRIKQSVAHDKIFTINSNPIVKHFLDNSIAVNFFMVGHAWQLGLIPLNLAAIEQAIELNNVAVEFNKQALYLGRLSAHDPDRIARQLFKPIANADPLGVDGLFESRMDFLGKYQNKAYAQQFRKRLDQAIAAEQVVRPGHTELSQTIAVVYSNLLAYKDEYEIGRLYSDGVFLQELGQQFGADTKLTFHLSPPLLARKDPITGLPRKMKFGPWILPVFKVLAQLKFLRGTAFDIFGYTNERRSERALIKAFEADMNIVVSGLSASNYESAVKLMSVYGDIKGFGYIKSNAIRSARTRLETFMADFTNGTTAGGTQAQSGSVAETGDQKKAVRS